MALVAVAADHRAWEAGVFGWFLAMAALIGKWGREVADDMDTRKAKGKPRLGRDLLGINASLNAVFIVVYRRRMFRDAWSRRRVMRASLGVP